MQVCMAVEGFEAIALCCKPTLLLDVHIVVN